MKLQGVIVTSENPEKLVEFYGKVFQKDPDWTGGNYSGFDLDNGAVIIGPHDQIHGRNPQPGRIMINFETADVVGEYDRIKGLGAKSIAAPYHPSEEDQMWLATLEDPDGNYIQLGSPIELKN